MWVLSGVQLRGLDAHPAQIFLSEGSVILLHLSSVFELFANVPVPFSNHIGKTFSSELVPLVLVLETAVELEP